MEYTEILSEALSTLTVNKMRTFLATLGIVIGIGSVIALLSLGQATQKAVTTQIQSLGSNLLTVRPGSLSQGGVRGAQGGRTTLTNDDAKAIQTSGEITTVDKVSPELQNRTQVSTGGQNTNTQIIGVTEEYALVHGIEIAEGNFINSNDVTGLTKVAVLGPQARTDLFGETLNPIGQTVRINGQTFNVIGTTVSKGGSGFFNQDDVIFVPLSAAQKIIFGSDYLTSIALQAKSSEVMTEAQNQVGYLLLNRHQISNPEDADFSILSQADILNTAASATGTFTALLSGIAAISLLVGGIGIMNIMLVTVTERTREIGLRKALGAKKQTVVTQFLTESVILTFTGGIIGIGTGIVASLLISKLTSSPFVVSLNSILLAFLVSAGIGILFGWYPARKASNLQPIEALRYE